MKKRVISIFLSCALILSCFAGCSIGTDTSKVPEMIVAATSAAGSVQASVYVELNARLGTAGGSIGHTASLGADISVKSTREPFAYHGEYYSRILIDGKPTVESKECYVVQNEDHTYNRFEYDDATDTWSKNLLTREEELSLPLKTCAVQNWDLLLNYLELENASAEVDGVPAYHYVGEIPAIFIQEIVGNRVFGSFLFSMEQILNDKIICNAYFDAQTYLPIQMVLDFTNCFTVSDMLIDSATITAEYKKWNAISEIELPKKISVTAVDEVENFFATYYAWNLFMPYVNVDPGSTGNSNLINSASWESFQLRIDQSMLQLPIFCRTLYELGYTVSSEYSTYILEADSVVYDVPVQRGADVFYCSFYNQETYSQPITDCRIGSIDVNVTDTGKGGMRLFLPGDLTLGTKRDNLVAAYGESTTFDPGFSIDTYIWEGANEGQSLLVEVSPVNNQVIRIRLENIPIILKNDQNDNGTDSTEPTEPSAS